MAAGVRRTFIYRVNKTTNCLAIRNTLKQLVLLLKGKRYHHLNKNILPRHLAGLESGEKAIKWMKNSELDRHKLTL